MYLYRLSVVTGNSSSIYELEVLVLNVQYMQNSVVLWYYHVWL